MNRSRLAEAGKARSYLNRLSQTIDALDTDAFDHAIGLIRTAWQNDKQIIVFGNGGSALTAQHYVTDWNKAIYLKTRRPFRGVCLAENMGLITAYANDISYNDVFLEQLKPILKKGDLVIGVSGSGNSENVLRPIRYANENGGITLGICGYDGGKLKQIAQHAICADVHDMQLSEDVHLIFGHMTMQTLCGQNLLTAAASKA
jgi:D-sedoheptulose 7-phosphate isomerase